ncbi:MAG: DnaJ domain-containing protein [Anaerolineae bacterium]|nr:DnaJ domain-containing protein [Anaerolineae bacterium]
MEEYGVTSEAQTLDQVFGQFFLGFAATPDDTVLLLGSGSEAWWQVLGVEQDAGLTAARNAYRALARRHHPDAGGDPEEFQRLRRAYEAAVTAIEGGMA